MRKWRGAEFIFATCLFHSARPIHGESSGPLSYRVQLGLELRPLSREGGHIVIFYKTTPCTVAFNRIFVQFLPYFAVTFGLWDHKDREYYPMTKMKKKQTTSDRAKYRPTDQENAAITKQIDRLRTAPVAPRLKVTQEEDVARIALDHPDGTIAYGLLMESLGTTNADFLNNLLSQLGNAGSKGEAISESDLNFLLSVIKDIKPKDQLEAMLAAQMAVVHMTTMTSAGRLSRAETLQQQDSAGALFIKLTRTFATQMEALKRYRTGGEQTVTVQHVNVGEGGQAIVGNVTQSSRETPSTQSADAQPLLTDASSTAMPLLTDKNPERMVRRKAK